MLSHASSVGQAEIKAKESKDNCLTLELSKEFLSDLDSFSQEMKARDGPEWYKLENPVRLLRDNLAKYGNYVDKFPFPKRRRFPNCSHLDAMKEDILILRDEPLSSDDLPEYAVKLGSFYATICAAIYSDFLIRHAEDPRMKIIDDLNYLNEMCRKGIRYDPNNLLLLHASVISAGWQAEHVVKGKKEKAFQALSFQEASNRYFRLDRNNPWIYYLTGRYYYIIARLNRIERTLARALLGVYLEGSYEEAEKYLLKSHELLSFDYTSTFIWLAKICLQLKRYKEAEAWLEKARQTGYSEPVARIEKHYLEEAQEELNSIK